MLNPRERREIGLAFAPEERLGHAAVGNLNLLENKNLKVEGCVMRICGNEEWRALNVSIDEDGSKSAVLKYENEENQLSR